MKFSSPFLAAARLALLSGALAASFATASIAGTTSGTVSGESRTSAVQAYDTQAAPEMNLHDLEKRVRATNAISVFHKLALQKEVNDLLTRVRHAHSGPNSYSELSPLRRSYDTLLANIQARLGRDPQLAGEISASREAIWNVLTDRTKFASL